MTAELLKLTWTQLLWSKCLCVPHSIVMATNGILKNYSFNIKPLYPLNRFTADSGERSGELASGQDLLFACILGYNCHVNCEFPWKPNIIMPFWKLNNKSIAVCHSAIMLNSCRWRKNFPIGHTCRNNWYFVWQNAIFFISKPSLNKMSAWLQFWYWKCSVSWHLSLAFLLWKTNIITLTIFICRCFYCTLITQLLICLSIFLYLIFSVCIFIFCNKVLATGFLFVSIYNRYHM